MRAKDGLKQLLREFAINPESDPGLKLQKYLSLLEKWNPRVNLTANIAWNALEPLFREGIWAARKYPADCRTHLDIGSGAGFPAIILRVLNNNVELEIVESRGKKGSFLETVAWELGLTETCVHVKRLEDLLAAYKPGKKIWDCVSWKAIRLASRDLLRLRDNHASENTLFWMFHGKEAAVEDASVFYAHFISVDKQPIPEQKESFLSIYRISNVSRETSDH
jgi:16S rRNA (guanine(527)-N(7))-methyltransferase RsmG